MTLKISYWKDIATGGAQAFADPISGESRSLSASSALSAATPDSARFIMIEATDTDAYYAYGEVVGKSPTATTASIFLPSGRYHILAARAGHKVAAITG